MKKLSKEELGDIYCELFYGRSKQDVIHDLRIENGEYLLSNQKCDIIYELKEPNTIK